MQKVELYCDALKAKWEMEKWIRSGWRVHTCTISTYKAGYDISDRILVVYEKE